MCKVYLFICVLLFLMGVLFVQVMVIGLVSFGLEDGLEIFGWLVEVWLVEDGNQFGVGEIDEQGYYELLIDFVVGIEIMIFVCIFDFCIGDLLEFLVDVGVGDIEIEVNFVICEGIDLLLLLECDVFFYWE